LTLRIAHFIQRYPPALGGSEAYFARLSRYLAARGDDITVFTSNALALESFWSRRGPCLPASEKIEAGVRVRRYSLWRMRGRRLLLKALSYWPERTWQCLTLPCNPIAPGMWRDAGRPGESFDVVHAAAFPYAFPIVCARRLARRLGVPFIVTPFLHLGDPDDPRDPTRRAYTRAALRSLLRSADRVFAQTESEWQALVELGVAPGQVVLQGLGVEVAECTGGERTAVRERWGIKPGEAVIGHLANNSQEKGTIDLLRAMQLLWRREVPARLMLAGPEMPNFRGFWASMAPSLPSGAVQRLGILSDAQKRDFFAGLDVFALPSRSDSFGLVLLEAWANGLANVAYGAGGIADLIRHERDGLLVRCGDVTALADALGRLGGDAPLRRRLGQTGRARLPREFRWPDKLDLVRQVYEDVTSRGLGSACSRARPALHGTSP
jgi:glycosyltransferase involved in cell wall biosynthesis